MKKRSFKICLIFVALLCGTFLMSACKSGSVSFVQSQITMGVNDEIYLKDIVEVDGCSIDSVKFESSEPSIVLVTPRKTLVAGGTEGTAFITAKGYDCRLEVTVEGYTGTFSAPTNVHFNQDSGRIEWDNVYLGSVIANTFKVSISKDGAQATEHVVNKNYYELTEFGDFTVTVSCMERLGVLASTPSEQYTFKKLPTPTNLVYNAQTGILKWDEISGVDAYYVVKDGVVSEIINDTQYTLELTEEKQYSINVMSATSSDEQNVFGAKSEQLCLTRLKSPTLEISAGNVKWVDNQAGVSQYVLKVFKSTNDHEDLIDEKIITHNGYDYSYKLSNISSGYYNVKVVAIGDGGTTNLFDTTKHYLNSSLVETGTLYKLDKPTLSFDLELKQLIISDFDSNGNYQLNLNGEKIDVDFATTSGKYAYNFDVAGEYSFELIQKAQNNKQIDSDPSDNILVIKLAEINSVAQSVSQDGYYELSGLTLNNADSFVVRKIFNGGTTTLLLDDGKYGKVDAIFAEEGEYTIMVTASGISSNNRFVLDSQTSLIVKRPQKIVLSDNESLNKIEWSNTTGYDVSFEYALTGGTSLSGTTKQTYFEYANLEVGSYAITVNSLTNEIGSVLVLPAYENSTCNFKVTKQIAKPTVSISRMSSGYNLNITPTNYADEYYVQVNSGVWQKISHTSTDTIVFDITSSLNSTDEQGNIVKVYANNSENSAYYLRSAEEQLTVKKIASPTTFSVSEIENVSVDKPYSYILNDEILINDVSTTSLDENTDTFVVKVKYISDLQKYNNNTYYIDSSYATFTLQRIGIDVKVKGLLAQWSIESTTQHYTTYISINNVVSQIASKQLNLSALASMGLEVNFTQGIEGQIICSFGEINGTIGDGTTYYISNHSKNVTIKYADEELGVNVVENAGVVNVGWTNKENASYVLYDGEQEKESLVNSATVNSNVYNTAKKYTLSLTETIDNDDNIYVYVLFINRLSPITALTVDENESLQVASQVGAEKAVIVKDGVEADTLSGVGTSSIVLTTKYKAIAKDSNNNFYLDSAEKSYSFVRLAKLNTVGNLKIYNNIINWTKEGDVSTSAYAYKIKFFDDKGTTPTILDIKAQDTNGIDLMQDKYQQILNGLSGQKYVSIQKYVGVYNAKDTSLNYLSSEYSSDVLLKIIEAPKDVTISVGEDTIKQQNVVVSWTQNKTGVDIAEYEIAIIHNGSTTTVKSDGQLVVDENSQLFKSAGVWEIKVKAIGSKDSITSNYSESVSVVRLANPTDLLLSKNGTISWSNVGNASEYRVEYKYVNNSGETKTNYTTIANDQTSTDFFVSQLSEQFSGNINITLYAIGNGSTTLSSKIEGAFVRLAKPSIKFESNRLIVENYDVYPNQTTIYVVGKIDGKLVLNKEISLTKDASDNYYWNIPNEFSYIDEQGHTIAIDVTKQNVLSLELDARNQSGFYLNSNVQTCQATILSPVSNLRFVRQGDIIHFLANNTNTSAVKSTLTIGDYSTIFTNNIDLALTDDVLEKFGTNWQITITANGELIGATQYINSKTVSISGTKLEGITSISTSNGQIVWNEISGASDYKVLIDETTEKTGYSSRKEPLQGEEFASGEHIISIRAIGNVGNSEITTDIVLDGDYSYKYTVTKLSTLSDLDIKNGMFTFTEIEKATKYSVQVFKDLSQSYIAEYDLVSSSYMLSTTEAYYCCPKLNEKIAELGELYVKLYCKTTEDNYVYSNFAMVEYNGATLDYIKVTNLDNASQKVELYNPLKPDGVNYDYLTTIARWSNNNITDNGYVLMIDNQFELLYETNYTLDSDTSWEKGKHTIAYVQLGSNGLTGDRLAYLTNQFSTSVTVTKLDPVLIDLIEPSSDNLEMSITYRAVNGANKYYAYTDDVFYKEYSDSSLGIMMDELREGIVYSSFGMRAVNTQNVNYIASSIKYLTRVSSQDENEYRVQITKVKAPTAPTFKNGAFYWELTNEQWINLLQGKAISSPFAINSIQDIQNQIVAIKFKTKTAPVKTYTYYDSLTNYLYMSDSQKEQLISIVSLGGYDKDEARELLTQVQDVFKGGFASIRYGFDKFAKNLPVGAYTIEIAFAGQGLIEYIEPISFKAKFTSDFVSIGTKYVAPATSITAIAQEGIYSLEFNNVSVDANYVTSAPSYYLIGVYYDEQKDSDIEKMLLEISSSGVNISEKIQINLTALINAGKLDGTFKQLYVILKGDSNVLNGKTSNIITISVLDEIQAKVEHGVIKWRAQEYASKYQITYLENGKSNAGYIDVSVENGLEWYSFAPTMLASNIKYAVSIQACGLINSRINTSEEFKMSGMVTPIGDVIKLEAISTDKNGVDISNGLFKWNSVSNATSYDVYYKLSSKGVEIDGSETIVNVLTNTQYEVEVTDDKVYNYYFMAVGTEDKTLVASSLTYVNSPISSVNVAKRVGTIDSISYNDGMIEFKPNQYSTTGYYKLTFYKLDSSGERGHNIVVYTNKTVIDTNDYDSLRTFGSYDLDIQAVYQNKTKVINDDAYYVISNNKPTNYYKFDTVNIVKVSQGRIAWTFDYDENIIATSDYQFRLEFTTPTKKEAVVFYVPATQTYFDEVDNKTYYYFEDVVYDSDILATDNITINVYVWANESAKNNYVKSIKSEYLDGDNETIFVHQYEKIDEEKIEITMTESLQLMVDWTNSVTGSVSSGFKYEISFSAEGKEEKFYTTEPKFVTGEGNNLSFNAGVDYKIVLKIRVIPVEDNYISSAWSKDKEISRPKSVSGLTFDEQKQAFTWDKYQGTSNWDSYKYKIRDVVSYQTELPDGTTETITEIYILSAKLNDEYYEPFVMGTHIVSVAVMVANTAEDSNFISEYAVSDEVTIDLFSWGDGSKNNPYLISNEEEFANIKYRLSKDAKNNRYYHGTIEYVDVEGEENKTEVITIDDKETVAKQAIYYFKQINHIVIEKSETVDQTLNVTDAIFKNVYDGDYYSLTLNYIAIETVTGSTNISIFNTIGSGAVVQNIKLLFNMSANIYKGNGSSAYINVLCYQNDGKIDNIVIGETTETLEIQLEYLNMYLSFIAFNNTGTISNVVNNYNVTIKDEYEYSSYVQYASLVIFNNGEIQYVKNVGNITVTGGEMYVGGLVVQNDTGATLMSGANVGNITVYYNKVSHSSYVGGLIAYNGGQLSYCYNVNSIAVDSSGSCVANIGGLVGFSIDCKISYSFANVGLIKKTKQELTDNFTMCMLVGMLTNVSSKSVEQLYYNNNDKQFTSGCKGVNCTGFDAISEIVNSVVKLYGTEEYQFNSSDLDASGNPKLNFEAKFETIEWKE